MKTEKTGTRIQNFFFLWYCLASLGHSRVGAKCEWLGTNHCGFRIRIHTPSLNEILIGLLRLQFQMFILILSFNHLWKILFEMKFPSFSLFYFIPRPLSPKTRLTYNFSLSKPIQLRFFVENFRYSLSKRVIYFIHYLQVTSLGKPEKQPVWNHPFLFSEERDNATMFTPGAALVLEYYTARSGP